MPEVRQKTTVPECVTENSYFMAATEQRNNDEAKDRCASSDLLSSTRLSYESRVYPSMNDISAIMIHLHLVMGSISWWSVLQHISPCVHEQGGGKMTTYPNHNTVITVVL